MMSRLMVALVSVVLLLPGVALARDGAAVEPRPAAFGAAETVVARGDWAGLDLAVDGAGHLHLVTAGGIGQKRGIWYGTDRTGSWSFKRIVASSGGTVWRSPHVVIGPGDRVVVAMDRVDCEGCAWAEPLGVFSVTDRGRTRGTFGDPVRLSPDGTTGGSLRIAGGHRFVAYHGDVIDHFGALRMRTDASGSWTTSTIASRGGDVTLRIGLDGRPRVAFVTGDAVRYGVAGTLTGGWTTEAIVNGSGLHALLAFSIDEAGTPHVLWKDATGSHLATRGPGGWTAKDAPDLGSFASLSIDKPGMPWLAGGIGSLKVARPVEGELVATTEGGGPVEGTAIKVLDSGGVVVAWIKGSDGIRVIRS